MRSLSITVHPGDDSNYCPESIELFGTDDLTYGTSTYSSEGSELGVGR